MSDRSIGGERAARLARRARGVAKSFSTEPAETLRTLDLVPRLVDGLLFAEKWPEPNWKSGDPDSIDDRSHQLLEYFDSVEEGPGIWKWRHYFDIYERHLKKFVGRDVHVVEVGVYSGGSLRMWRQFFGANCHMYGVDIEESAKAYEDDATRVFIGDQADRSFWKRFREEVPVVDVLVDDGGHLADQQIPTLEEMVPHLRPGGVYICEDVLGHLNPLTAYVSGLALRLNTYDGEDPSAHGLQASIDSVHFYPYVAVLEKALARVEGFRSEKHGTEWEPYIRPW